MASAWSTTPGSNIDKVDARLTGALERAAKSFAQKNPGYTVQGFSGKRSRKSTKNHPAGTAIDVNIMDPSGKKLGNLRNAATFRTYEKFAQEVRRELDAVGLTDVGRWGGYFKQGVAFDQMHFDLDPRNNMAYGTWENGLNAAGMSALPGAVSVGMNQRQLPNEMTAPKTLAQTLAAEAVTNAYTDPSRALSALPASIDVPSVNGLKGAIFNAPAGFARPELANAAIGRSLAAAPTVPASFPAARPSLPATGLPAAPSVNPSRFGYGAINGVRPSAPSVSSLPAAPAPSYSPTVAARPEGIAAGMPAAAPAIDRSVSPSNPSQLGGITTSSPVGLGGPGGMYLGGVPSALPDVPATASIPAAPVAPAVAPPAIAAPPAQVLAPALAPPTVVRDYNVASLPSVPSAPRATAYDVYSGLADTATDNTGQNTVTRNIDGTTSVTNKYGVTTTTMPDGKQAATGSLPSLPGIEGIGGKVTGAMPAIGGSLLGGALAGAPGALLGGLLAKSLSQPGGLFSGLRNIDTSKVSIPGIGPVTAFARPNYSLNNYPDRPAASRGGYTGSASFSNRSQSGMRSISPGAASAISKGQGGLY